MNDAVVHGIEREKERESGKKRNCRRCTATKAAPKGFGRERRTFASEKHAPGPIGDGGDRIAVTRIAPTRCPEIRRLDGIDKDDFDFVEQLFRRDVGLGARYFSLILPLFYRIAILSLSLERDRVGIIDDGYIPCCY